MHWLVFIIQWIEKMHGETLKKWVIKVSNLAYRNEDHPNSSVLKNSVWTMYRTNMSHFRQLFTWISIPVHMLIRTCKLAFVVTHLPPTAKHDIISCFEGNRLLVFWSLLSSYLMEFCKRIQCMYSTTHEAEFPTRN